MNLIEKIMLKLGYIKLDRYEERVTDMNFYHKAFSEGYEIIEDLRREYSNINDDYITDYLLHYSIDR